MRRITARRWFPTTAVIAAVTAATAVVMTTSVLAGGGRGGDQPIGPDSQMTMEIVGFSDDGRDVGLKISDDQGRFMMQKRDVKKGNVSETVTYFEGKEKGALRKLKKKGVTAEPLGAENKDGIILMSAQKGNELLIYAMKGETCTKQIAKIKLTKVKESKRTEQPEAFAKQLVWGPKGKYVAVVYHEKYKKTYPWEGDKFFGFKFKAYKANCSAASQ